MPANVAAGSGTLRIATWNINSVRLRLPLLSDLVMQLDPDVLCLQETKCPDEHFPHEGVAALGFTHRLARGMKGYNGVAILSKRPILLRTEDPDWCLKGDCRHLGVAVDAPGGPIELHNFYIPAGGDIPDREKNPKFGHKLDFVAEATAWSAARPRSGRSWSATSTSHRSNTMSGRTGNCSTSCPTRRSRSMR
jgi:exodeoxyribonuclease-3